MPPSFFSSVAFTSISHKKPRTPRGRAPHAPARPPGRTAARWWRAVCSCCQLETCFLHSLDFRFMSSGDGRGLQERPSRLLAVRIIRRHMCVRRAHEPPEVTITGRVSGRSTVFMSIAISLACDASAVNARVRFRVRRRRLVRPTTVGLTSSWSLRRVREGVARVRRAGCLQPCGWLRFPDTATLAMPWPCRRLTRRPSSRGHRACRLWP